jgi:hypothetical protein
MSVASPAARGPAIAVKPAYFIAAALTLAVMVYAILREGVFLLNFIHVMSGVLWTGIDLFLGFIIGPILRRQSWDTRRAFTAALIPRTMVLMPTLAIVTGTSGWFLAQRMGYLDLGYPEFWWVAAALAIITILTIQGLGILTPTNILVYLEMQKAAPDVEKIGRWMRTYVRVVAIQGVMQVAIIVVMARFGAGL